MHNSKAWVLGLVIAIACAVGGVHAGDTRNVSTRAELQQALSNTSDTTEITLQSGDYGVLSIHGLKKPAGMPLVLRSIDPANPARFSKVILHDVQNVTIDSVIFDYSYQTGDKIYYRPFQALLSVGVTIRNSFFDGDLWRGEGEASNGYPTAFGMAVRFSSDLTFEDNEIRGFFAV
ncbi:hypothetical protein EOK75_20385 (plasmid) [Pseudorhodobacter turbinis]|uniref:Uncharacterized protein n=1 Tax=Pseudorhodobacter turbinis TaxID=2500533 RepID=A0A4P8ELE8_9RHOB|nr:hypothetical protein [Pseudorhodobacter turbinis]QCO58120.1 hypothetical protein EOK75_20385 [Pseudorhodobacter turbinis]